MDTRFAIFFAICVVAAIAVDVILFDWHYIVFWGRKFMQFTQWIAFWR